MMNDRLVTAAPRPRRVIARRNLHDQIVDELGRPIVSGEYGPEESLPTEPQLAADLGVGRNALREAVKVLVSKGMVEVRPKTGMRVRPAGAWSLLDREVLSLHAQSALRLERSFDMVEFRLIVEPKAAHLAARRASRQEIAAIADSCARLEACVGRPELVPERDIAFHRSIHHASHNAILDHLGLLIASLMQMQVVMTTERPGSFERGLSLHRELAEAIAAREAGH